MAIFSKRQEVDGSWRLLDENASPIGRFLATAHIDRIIRDADLAEAVFLSAKHDDIERGIAEWQVDGGRSVDFSAIVHSLNNDAGIPDGNIHILLGGQEIGFYHGTEFNEGKVLRFTRLAEEIEAALTIVRGNTQDDAVEAAVQRMKDDGGLD